MFKNTPESFADVVVFAPTDPSKNFFTYSLPQKLSKVIAIGQLVSVPWGKKTTHGIVIEIKNQTQVKNPKPLKKILLSTPLLLPKYIELLKWMSWYYHAPMIDCLKAILPETRISHIANDQSLKKIKKDDKRQAISDKQILILVPNINQISLVLPKQKRSKDILIYHKQLPKKELWRAWWEVYQGKTSQILGTRSALFAQCPNLTEIRIINEEDSSFKDMQSPYFDTLKVAAKLCQISGAKLRIETLTPRVETYFNFVKKLVKKKPKNRPKITIIDLSRERKSGNRKDISDTLRNILIGKIGLKKRVLLFLNRLKESGQVYCLECKFSGYSQTAPSFCPNCKGGKFKFFSLNLRLVGKQLAKLAPTVGLKLVTEGKTTIIQEGTPTITLATSAIFSQDLPKFSLIGVISVDTILNLPDFNSSFRTFSTLIKLTQLADKDCEVLIQTSNPQHLSIKSAQNWDFEKFYQEELVLRKKLELPPFATLAKLTIKLKDQEKARFEAEKLTRILEKKSLLVEISEPIQNWQSKPEFNIILKAKKREDLDNVLSHVTVKWKVVVDPDSLL